MILPIGQSYTIESAIRTAAACFEREQLCYGHGTESAIDEASWIVLDALQLSPQYRPDYSQTLDADQVAACNRLLRRRVTERIPAAYLTGRAWFAGHEFVSDNRALVPRSPLAEFINNDFFGMLDGLESPRVLDLCTGGGCIAIACAHRLPGSVVDASDLSVDALALARQNIELHLMQERVRLLQGSLFDPIDKRYDLIISNPPYVDAVDIEGMSAEFRHEPILGLAAGSDGLDLVRTMLTQAADYLTPNGYLVVEVGNSWVALEQAYPCTDFAWLEFSNGGIGVFVLNRQQLLELVSPADLI